MDSFFIHHSNGPVRRTSTTTEKPRRQTITQKPRPQTSTMKPIFEDHSNGPLPKNTRSERGVFVSWPKKVNLLVIALL